jgi:hypothetical protein
MTESNPDPTPRPPLAASVPFFAVHRLRRIAAAGALTMTCIGAHAAPDAVSRFLAEHGLAAGDDAAQAPRDTTMPPGLIDQVKTTASELVLAAMNFLGVPYRFGGNSQDEGFDCSGFTRHVFALALGLVLPRRSDEQALAAGLLDIPRDALAPGDLCSSTRSGARSRTSASMSAAASSSTPRVAAARCASRTCGRATGRIASTAHAGRLRRPVAAPPESQRFQGLFARTFRAPEPLMPLLTR